METLTRVLARHVYSLDLSESVSGDRGRGGRRVAAAPAPLPRPALPHHAAAVLAHSATRTPGTYVKLVVARSKK